MPILKEKHVSFNFPVSFILNIAIKKVKQAKINL